MTQAEIIAAKVLSKLGNRRGFEEWWDGMSATTQIEIIDGLAKTIQGALNDNLDLSAVEKCYTIDDIKECRRS